MEGKKKKKKKLLDILFWIFILFGISFNILVRYFPFQYEWIKTFITDGKMINKLNVKDIKNEYYLDYDFESIKNMDILFPKDKTNLTNVIRTILNAGSEKTTFYCHPDYDDCYKDLDSLQDNDSKITYSYIYPFIHPFNDFSSLKYAPYDNVKKIDFMVEKKYTKEQIDALNKKIDEIYNALYDENATIEENILKYNDYLVDTIEYDEVKAAEITDGADEHSIFASNTAYGALFDGQAICSGYTDAMFLYLEKLGLKQVRVVGVHHIWNAVEIDGKWYHIDVTWNDSKKVRNKYFLLTTDELLKKDAEFHTFNEDLWKELV